MKKSPFFPILILVALVITSCSREWDYPADRPPYIPLEFAQVIYKNQVYDLTMPPDSISTRISVANPGRREISAGHLHDPAGGINSAPFSFSFEFDELTGTGKTPVRDFVWDQNLGGQLIWIMNDSVEITKFTPAPLGYIEGTIKGRFLNIAYEMVIHFRVRHLN
jgi:hypothetical protein